MDKDKQSKPSPDRLPKSVKVRSTCNACQQAKIRCSHDKPSCRRCQKHNIECIYSMSRRLGRPAKRRESQYAGLPVDTHQNGHHRHQQRDKKVSTPKRTKPVEDLTQDRTDDEDLLQNLGETVTYDKTAVTDTPLDDVSLEDSSLRTSIFGDNDELPSFAVSDAIDFSSDNWLQEFLSQQAPDLGQEPSLLDSLAFEDTKADKAFPGVSTELKDLVSSPKDLPTLSPNPHDQPPPMSLYSADDFAVTTEAIAGSSQGLPAGQSSYPEYLKKGLPTFSQHISTADSLSARLVTATEPQTLLTHQKGLQRTNDYVLSSDSISMSFGPLNATTARQCQCQCHEQTIRELIRVNICASRTGPSATLDSILNCQRILQHLAETILQCAVCSKTRVNLLMVVIVSIDSLITTLEVITSGDGGMMDGILPEFHDHMFLRHDYGQEITLDGSSRRYKSGVFRFRAQVESCPLMVGGFCVPPEEKFSFVHQVLYARLTGLLAIIRRIRHCTQQILAVSASRGRLSMMMETDRRLQIFMMRMRMFTRS